MTPVFEIKASCFQVQIWDNIGPVNNPYYSSIPSTYDQTGIATIKDVDSAVFEFDSFETYTMACQVLRYEILHSKDVRQKPDGIKYGEITEYVNMFDFNTITSPDKTGAASNNVGIRNYNINTVAGGYSGYIVEVEDGTFINKYEFIIRAWVEDGNFYDTQALSLDVVCPVYTSAADNPFT